MLTDERETSQRQSYYRLQILETVYESENVYFFYWHSIIQ